MERRKISRELHDGLIQDLTSLGYSLPAVAAELPADAAAARAVLDSVGRRLRGDIASLRGVLTDLYPVGLAREGSAELPAPPLAGRERLPAREVGR